MLKACLSLLLLRADASSYGFTVAGIDSPLVHARGYVNNNVVNASRNDPNSMHNSEVLCPRMDNLSTHTLDGYRTLFTTPLHESQSVSSQLKFTLQRTRRTRTRIRASWS